MNKPIKQSNPLHLVACRSEVVTDEGAFHKFISVAALHTATQHLACPLTLSLRQATSIYIIQPHSRYAATRPGAG
jgi:hypothetical protein